MLGITTSGISAKNTELISQLKNNNIFIIDCSLTNLLSKDWSNITEYDVQKLSYELESNLIQVNSIQSIFYNKEVNFSNSSDMDEIVNHLKSICKYAKILKCKKLLFGSPKQRQNIDKFDNFIKTFYSINYLMSDTDMIFNIENLDYQKNVLLKTSLDIINFIESHKLNNCKINLHLFVEDYKTIDAELLKNYLIDTIHFSDYNYTDNLINNNSVLLEGLFKATKYNKHNKILEFNTEKTNITLKNVNNLLAFL